MAALCRWILLLLITVGMSPAEAAERVALVVGNGAYRHAPGLLNPRNDAEDIGRALRELGFETIVATDLDRAGMNDALDRFSRTIAGAEIALVYYSGHGMQFAGRNFLLPVDARLANAEDINKFRLLPLDDIFETLLAAQRRLVVLDACRNNPVEEDLKRRLASLPGANRDAYLSRGLGRIPPGNGLIVAYSTAANDVAGDGVGRNSPFTTAFLKHVGTPDLDLRQMLFRVQDEVDRQTQGRQRPELSLSPIRELKLRTSTAANAPASPAQPLAPPVVHPPPFDPRAMELSYWESVRSSTSPAVIQTYLDRYPNGTFSALAKARIQDLQKPPQPPQPLPPRPPAGTAALPPSPAPPPSPGLIARTHQRPSIDCNKPNEPIEHLICADAELAEWDGRMGQLYTAKRNDGRRNRDAFRQQQLDWIDRRNAECRVPRRGNWSIAQLAPLKPCMLRMTKERVNALASQ
jgi:uncharacterized protein YecT (DUF1311 family)